MSSDHVHTEEENVQILLDRFGKIEAGKDVGKFVYVNFDAEDTGGYYIFVGDDNKSLGYDTWAENFDDVKKIFEETQWKIRWENDLTKAEIVNRLSATDVAIPVGFMIEKFYKSKFSVEESDVPIFERFLCAPRFDNRSAALNVLIGVGKRSGYEADALQLFFDAGNNRENEVELMAMVMLTDLKERGSSVAERILYNLQRDERAQLLGSELTFRNPDIDKRLSPKI